MKKIVLTIAAIVGIQAGCMPMRSVTSFENEGNAMARPTIELEPELDADWGIALGRGREIPPRVQTPTEGKPEPRGEEVAGVRRQ